MEANVWLTLQMQQQVILTLLTNVAQTFETMFLKQVMVGEVSAAEIGFRYCGTSTRKEEGAGGATYDLKHYNITGDKAECEKAAESLHKDRYDRQPN
ncbi:hypothetical protein PF005_g2745 [Phytophthora fragariae]|uniref:Uncharacterized protein n=1 Tax=Phytophthora fragariae TaxID=53985 RepID=A0A6A3MBK3_9STRA|nr:hypothetical protein PF003_g20046 [Phytophthora fragariae]KAE8947658.1 hypothetical protein PF009_g2745 [Phytophthora fragariae]KAE9027260.1 hypothetical protein PF011_g2143 [Phytophthora fragariae]KAE9135161.1 hypothetical protein PF010_g2183 [Phytophthora fragariae]KAE9135393.1 hypothetical protein PF007_g2573 [Phytophthora fragariae]